MCMCAVRIIIVVRRNWIISPPGAWPLVTAAPGQSETGNQSIGYWLLVGEECFNFLTNKSGQGEIGHPRLDNASA